MEKFVKLDGYGQLYIDKILLESYFPVIFTCINSKKDIFISVCCQNNERGCKWLLGKTDGLNVAKMLQDKITIRQLLLEYSSDKISVDYSENEYITAHCNSDWNSDSHYLPKEDSYMHTEDGEFDDEINYFLSLEKSVNYNSEYYKRVTETQDIFSKESESAAWDLTVMSPVIESIVISSEIVNTLKVSGELRANYFINEKSYTNQERYKPIYDIISNISLEDLTVKLKSSNNNYIAAA